MINRLSNSLENQFLNKKITSNSTEPNTKPLMPIAKINGQINALAVNQRTGKIYALAENTDTSRMFIYVISDGNPSNIIPIDMQTNATALGNIDVSKSIVTDENFVYVLYDSTLYIIDGDRNEIVKTHYFPEAVAIDINTQDNTVYIFSKKDIYKINEFVTKRSKIPFLIKNAIFNSNNNTIYALTEEGQIYVIDESNMRIISNLTLPSAVSSIGLNLQKNIVYLLNEGADRLYLIDSNKNKFIRTIAGNITTYNGKAFLEVDPLTGLIYVGDDRSNYLSIVDGNSNKWLKTISVEPIQLQSIAVNPKKQLVYLSSFPAGIYKFKGNEQMLLKLQSSVPFTGKEVNATIEQLVVDRENGKAYFVLENERKIQVMDGSNDEIIKQIPLPHDIGTLQIDDSKGKLYAISKNKNNFTIIDTSSDRFNETKPIKRTNLFRVFLINEQGLPQEISKKNYYIDRDSQKIYFFDDNKIYDDGLNSIINFSSRVDDIAINSKLGLLYAELSEDKMIEIVDLKTGQIIGNIPLPSINVDFTVDSESNKIYLSDSASDTLSVLDGTNYTKLQEIPVGRAPNGVYINPKYHSVYVTNDLSKTLSVIDERTNNMSSTVSFYVQPNNAGYIECDGTRVATNKENRISYGSNCIAKSNKGFEFSNWEERIDENSSKVITPVLAENAWLSQIKNLVTFFENGLGLEAADNYDLASLQARPYTSYNANFVEVPPPLPPEYSATIFAIIVSSILGSWFIPSIISGAKSKLHIRRFNYYQNRIANLKNVDVLDGAYDDLVADYTKGKIMEQHYLELKNKISFLYEELFGNKINSLDKPSTEDKVESLIDIEHQIRDAYSKGEILDLHHELLKQQILDYKKDHDILVK